MLSDHTFYIAKVHVSEIRDEHNTNLTWTRLEGYDLRGDQVVSIQFINMDASAEFVEWSYQRESDDSEDREARGDHDYAVGFDPDIEALHEEARQFMALRPDLKAMSLDEWLLEHDDKLSVGERMRGNRLLRKFPEYGGNRTTFHHPV